MLTMIAILALVSVPYLLDIYFNAPQDSELADEEYVPDGR